MIFISLSLPISLDGSRSYLQSFYMCFIRSCTRASPENGSAHLAPTESTSNV